MKKHSANDLRYATLRVAERCCRVITGKTSLGKAILCLDKYRTLNSRGQVVCLNGHVQRGVFKRLAQPPQAICGVAISLKVRKGTSKRRMAS